MTSWCLSLCIQVHTLEVFQKELNESEHLVFQAVHSLQRALQGDYRDVVNMKESSRQRLEALREAAIKVRAMWSGEFHGYGGRVQEKGTDTYCIQPSKIGVSDMKQSNMAINTFMFYAETHLSRGKECIVMPQGLILFLINFLGNILR